MAKKIKKAIEEKAEVEVAVIEEKTRPLALRYINLCHEKGLNGLETDKLTDAQLDALVKHLTR